MRLIFCCFLRKQSLIGPCGLLKQHRELSFSNERHSILKWEGPKWMQLDYYRFWRRQAVNALANKYRPERVQHMGPDFACLEWLMNAGATSVLMSDGTRITSQKEMRKFLLDQGFDVKKIVSAKAPAAELAKDFASAKQYKASLTSDIAYEKRWRNISPIHMTEVDASDAVITDQGFKYFLECKNIQKMNLNFNDYFGDEGLRELALGRPVQTLKELEIVLNPVLTDAAAFILCRFRSLRRLHLYFLPYVVRRVEFLRQLKTGLPLCNSTFPEEYFIGMGYETEEEKLAFKRLQKQKGVESVIDKMLRRKL